MSESTSMFLNQNLLPMTLRDFKGRSSDADARFYFRR